MQRLGSSSVRKAPGRSRVRPGQGASRFIPLLSALLLAYVPAAFAKPDACANNNGAVTCSGNQSNGIVGGQDFPLSSTFSLTVKDLTSSIFPSSGTAIQWRLNQPSFNVNELFSSPTYSLFGFAPLGAFAAGIDLESRGGGPGGSGRGVNLSVNGSATASGSSGAAVYGFVSGNDGSGSSGGSLNITLGPTPPADPIAHNGTLSGLGVSGLAGFGQGGRGSNGSSSFDSSGGNGGQGGTGGSVFLTGTGGNWTITSTGANAPGVLLQSTAGDGGTGGDSTFTTGGTGGQGGQGGIVKFDLLAGQVSIGTGAGAPGSAGLLLISQAGMGGRGGSGKIAGDGGSGGAGGGGGEIDMLATHLDITTLANSPTSPGIAAYSLGGTGGRGGDGGFFSGGGGGGGDTGPSGTVTVNLQGGMIETQALNSSGIVAQSVAGHAGAGGGQIPASFASFGANGGSAGAAGTVNVTNGAAIRTNSDESIGIFAQSAGGGGGNGGSGFGIFYASGGNGGVGGNGGQVMVTNSGTLTTSGADAQGIVAQSVGGAGGNGGIPGGIVASVGGRAADGSMGGPVTVMNSGAISTGADHIPNVPIETDTDPAKQSCSVGCSGGILAQSIGGGGGFGGTANAGWFSLGGTAGGGGNASTVQVTNTGDITTQLVDSPGITAQSVGGGGGNGGGSVSTAPFAAIAIGASGGGGGNGGVVNVYPTSGMQIHTLGDNSPGVIAQSTGAGGGNGGFAAAVSAGFNFSFSVAVGGSGAASGNGQDVTVMTNVDPNYRGPADIITTAGPMSDGILAQSVGEGGGNGGFAVSVTGAAKGVSAAFSLGGNGGAGGNGGNVNVISNANITTQGDMSSGLFAESTGKGGGNGGLAISGALQLTGAGLSVALGGSGAEAGTGGITTVVNAGTIQTFGAQSDGVVALSTGKGGGKAGVTVAAAASVGGQQSGNIALAVGGQGGRGGDASQVTIDNFGPVTVSGPNARGLVAESTGGGGGSGNVTVAATLQGQNPKELALAIGGNGEVAGNGGGVRVSNYAPVQTGSASLDPAMADDSPGILASSGGGSGGSGGLTGALTLGLATGDSTPLQAAVAVGGAGLGGGDSGLVTVDNYALVTTHADKSPAIEASSVGGGGGDASYVLAATGILGAPKNQNTALDVTIAVGKGGGTGGIGGPVMVTNTGAALTTFGDNSDAIQAHSEGGGGGNAGALLAFTATNVKGDISANVAIGGKGGKGANGGTVTVTNEGGTLTTSGQNSDGIRADSVGGSGGDGSLTLSGLAVNQGYSLDVAVGGNGGTGNNAGTVTAISRGPILTMGDGSDGISAISTGGGGGSARMTTAAGLARVAVDVTVGGTGGSGSDGGLVDVENYNAITTTGAGSRGIVAQSEGGGGGASQAISVGIGYESTAEKPLKVALGVSVGLPGGSGGAGGPVTVTNDGTITTGGISILGLSPELQIPTNESGIVARSVGGGGGDGGNALSLAPGITGGDSTYTLSVGVGGSGGKGGLGGTVIVNNNGTISTSDTESYGVFAQSIGNGGGKGGVATSIPGVLKNQTNTVNIAISVGGHGGEGNSAGPVTVTNTGSVTTNGDASHAIFAQSTGSGGGDGGSAFNYFLGTSAKTSKAVVNLGFELGGHGGTGGLGNTVTVTNSGTLTTTGDDANGIEAQSIGGGGGEGGNASALSTFPFTTVNANIGGTGGQGDNGGTVTITNNAGATITTTGSNSTGIYAQSIGGGGGRGGTGVLAPTINIALGGFGGENGNGGAVTVNMLGGTINTQGSGTSYGIWAQSVGGGGGQTGGIGVGIIDTPYYTPPPGYVGTSIPMGSGGSTGNGGPVNVIMNGAITTTGVIDGVGIFAQSVGGGGGVAGQAVCAAPCSDRVGSVGANGSSGLVKVSVNGRITTSGQYSHGIFAQSAAGTNSTAGDVVIGVTPGAAILANGADANAIWAQSVGGTNGQINIGVGTGATVQGGTGSSSAVRYLDGTGNILNNAGKIYTLNFENGLAVRSDGGSVAITNTGSIIGGTDLNGPANVFLNAPGGYFAPGPVVVLGAGNPLINAGVVEAGGGTIEAPTNFTGNFVQTPTGTLVVDLDPSRNASATSNPLNVSGTATLAGQVQVRVLDLGPGRTGPQTTPILYADQGLQLEQLAVIPSIVGEYRLVDPPAELALQYDIDFAAPEALAGLNSVDREIGAWLERNYLATGLPPAFSYLLGAGNAAQYGALLAGLSPEPYAVNRWATALSALQFSDRLPTCEGDATAVSITRGKDCISLAVEGWQYARHGSQAGADYTLNADKFSLVVQRQLDSQLRLNFGIGYGNWTAEATGNQWKTTTGQFDTGVMLEKQIGAATFGAGLTGGFSNPDVSRTILPGLTASGTQNVWYIDPTLHADYRFQFGNWYLKPKMSFNATYVSAGPVSESARFLGFSIHQQGQLFASISPALEVGGQFLAAPGYVIHPRVSVGLLQFLSNPSPSVSADFAGPFALPYPLTVTSGVDRSYLDLHAGIDLATVHNFSVSLGGFARLSANSHQVGGGLRIATEF